MTDSDATKVEKFIFDDLENALLAPIRLSKPVATAVDGHAIAGGFILALAADFVSLGENPKALAGLSELLVGVPFPPLPLLVCERQLPASSLRHFVYSGATMSLSKCYQTGGFGDAFSGAPEARATAWLSLVASRPPQAFALAKVHFRSCAHVPQ